MIKLTIREERCKGCGLCVRACPLGILALSSTRINSKGYHSAELVAPEKCIACASCARTCPDVCIEIEKTEA